jgi:hypothetical protein
MPLIFARAASIFSLRRAHAPVLMPIDADAAFYFDAFSFFIGFLRDFAALVSATAPFYCCPPLRQLSFQRHAMLYFVSPFTRHFDFDFLRFSMISLIRHYFIIDFAAIIRLFSPLLPLLFFMPLSLPLLADFAIFDITPAITLSLFAFDYAYARYFH